MKRIAGVVAATCLAGTLLTGCDGSDGKSSSPDETTDTSTSSGEDTATPRTTTTTTVPTFTGNYCADLKSAKNAVEVLGAAALTQDSFDQLSDVLHHVADETPDKVSDDWKTLVDAVDAIAQTLQTAGITFDDLDRIGQPGVPKVDRATLRALTHALNGLRGPRIAQAQTAINLEVKADCGFALDMGG